jgi:hypothetical protein
MVMPDRLIAHIAMGLPGRSIIQRAISLNTFSTTQRSIEVIKP